MNPARDTANAPFHLRFWGVRGSVPTACPGQLEIGGNTACMQIIPRGQGGESSDELLIFDAGTGIRALGKQIMARAQPPKAIHIFFTHFHWDHVQGLPFFLPLYSAKSQIVFHSVHPPEQLRGILAAQMQAPYFPVFFQEVPAQVEFRQGPVAPVRFGELVIDAFPLCHPQGSVGYRIVHPEKTVIYATDHEHGDEERDRGLIEAASGADVLVYDAQYTPAEYESRHGWGHSTWLDAIRMARHAGVKHLVLFHHDPDRDDAAVRGIEADARQEFAATHAAFEGMTL
jgi:phosphoribosyl 1,2-cyclic phosphodiesterase